MGGQFSSQFDHAASVLPLEDLADLHEASGASVHSRASGGPMNQREFVPSSHAPGRDDPMESLNQPENPESFNKILRQIRGEVNSRLICPRIVVDGKLSVQDQHLSIACNCNHAFNIVASILQYI